MHPKLENSHFVHVQDVACVHEIIFYAALVHTMINEILPLGIVRVGHAFVLVPPCGFDWFPFELFELENSSDALNRYVTISDRWDVVRVFKHK